MQLHGADFYKRLGKAGGSAKKTKPGGFAYMKIHDPQKVRDAGSKGGTISRKSTRHVECPICGATRTEGGLKLHQVRTHGYGEAA
jgi:general stress protein YciG